MNPLDHHQINQDLDEIRASSANIIRVLERDLITSHYVINALANVLNEGLVILDRDHNVTIINSAARSMLGIRGNEVIGSPLSHLYGHAYADNQRTIQREWTIIDPLTEMLRYLDVVVARVKVLDESDREAPALILTLRDITFKKTNEYRIHDLSSFQDTLIASLPVPTFYTDSEGGYIRGSASFFEMMGMSRISAMSKNIDQMLPKWAVRRFKDTRVSMDTISCSLETHNGTRQVLLYKGLLKSPEGELLGLIGSVIDREQMRDRSSEVVLNAVEGCPDALGLVSYPSGKIFFVNHAFSELFGYNKSEACNMNIKNILALDEGQYRSLQRQVIRQISKGQPAQVSLPIQCKAGSVCSNSFKILPIRKPGQTCVHYCMIVRES